MKELILVTTGLEDTWPESDKSILFLGEWCRLYSRKHLWKKFDSEIVPYHWDDRIKLYKDYQYLLELFERILNELATELNKIHGVSHTIRYWRIIIGPWLMMFLPVIFDRWSCLHVAIDKYPITNTKIQEGVNLNCVPQSMEHFSDMVKSDIWNHRLYSSILKFLKFEKISFIKTSKNISKWQMNKASEKKNILSKIKNMMIVATSLFSRNKNYFFSSTYLSKIDNIKLQLKLGQVPVIYQEHYSSESVSQQYFRKMTLSGFKCNSTFEQFAKEVIPMQMPTAYLEGYKELSERTNNIRWPKVPKLIWTSNSYFMDEIFKFWTAKKVEKGVPLVIGQHGGHYGQGLFSISEYHELKICDHYLSWGWGNGADKVIPVGTVKKPIKNKRKKQDDKPILFLITGTSRYSGGIASLPISSQWIDYLDDQMEFYENLPVQISSNVIIRLYPHDYEWSQFERWKDRFPDSKIDECKEEFNKVIANTKLFISGWNTTTYLESLLSNIPTVIFWEPEYFEIRDDAKGFFEKLKKVGILHDDPISAVNHVKKIWGDIDSWWEHPDVISARSEFTDKYAYSNDLLEKLCGVFKDISDR
ncbi:MAG: LIC12162 family protein [Gammaproteobacteria bacterium]|nr:LIC12162 family protein [Gammaproteobacteria bacterium]